MDSENKYPVLNIQNLIFTIRGRQVMLDSDLAEMYKVPSKRLNEQVKRNIERFPDDFRFQLTKEEFQSIELQFDHSSLRSQFATSKGGRGGRRYQPYVFTEQGVAMLSSILRSETAIKISIQIMQAFVGMRKFISNNAAIFQRLENVEQKQITTDKKFDQLFNALHFLSV